MNARMIKLFALLTVISFGLCLSSCKKDDKDKDENPNYQAAIDHSRADGVFNRAYNQISSASYQVTNKNTLDTIVGCPALYISGGASYPKTVTLDFGTNCVGSDGVTRSGKIVSVITAPYIQQGSVVTSTFDNYHEIIGGIDYQATGTQIITNMGNSLAGHPLYSVDVQGSVISQYGTITYTSQRQNEWIVGYNSWLNPWDDEYLVTGTASGNDINGDPFDIQITEGLHFSFFCSVGYYFVIKSGKFTLSYPGTNYPSIYVDYGSGTCDYIVYVTINGVTYTIVYT
jgi:hypothetical protein